MIGTLAATDAAAAFVTGFSQFENYEITIGDAVDITTATNEGMGDGDNVVETITISGGNALSSYTSTDGAIDGTSLTSFDASGFKERHQLPSMRGLQTRSHSRLVRLLTIH